MITKKTLTERLFYRLELKIPKIPSARDTPAITQETKLTIHMGS